MGGGEELIGSDVHTLCVDCVPSRILFRADMLQRRREEREAQELEWQREEEEKQNRLEVLRNQVELQIRPFNHSSFRSWNDPKGRSELILFPVETSLPPYGGKSK